MPAVMVGRQRDNPGNAEVRVWRAGEIVTIFEADYRFGFQEMPILPFGARSVDEVNALDVTTIPIYSSVQLTDSGTITSGTGNDVPVSTGEVIVLLADDSWRNYGFQSDVPDGYFHIFISNKTVEEVNLYLERFNKKLTYQTDQFDPATDLRRFTTTNVRVSASGNNGFTEQGITDAITEWNTNYPENTVELVDSDNLNYFQCDGIMPHELYDEWRLNTQRIALADYYRNRRWYITQAGLDALAVNDWTISGTADEVDPFLRDGLLD